LSVNEPEKEAEEEAKKREKEVPESYRKLAADLWEKNIADPGELIKAFLATPPCIADSAVISKALKEAGFEKGVNALRNTPCFRAFFQRNHVLC